jgi:DNA mismatch repair protein MutL
VDVNVHPTKAEVRFRDGGRIHGLVLSAVREVLLGNDLTPNAVPVSSDAEGPRQDLRAKLAEFFKQIPAGVNPPQNAAPTFSIPDLASGARAENTGGVPMVGFDGRGFANEGTPSVGTLPSNGASSAKPQAAIQLHNSYLVAQSDEGLVIIDQHALHERIMYEELLARLQHGPLESQRLLIPIPVNLSSAQSALLDHIQPLLKRIGIEIAPFGPGSVAVQSFPSFLERLDPGDFVSELLERGEQELLDLHEEEVLHEVLDMMACKAAVKAGDPLTPPEIEALLARRELVERSSNCPHGRPTTLRLSLKDLEKQFKRTGF